MIDTDNYIRFERVDDVEETATRPARPGCTASSCASTSSRDDVVRVKISRAGVFDESPTFAVCVDPLADAVPFTVEQADERRAAADRPRWWSRCGSTRSALDVHRTDGTPVVETAADDDGRYWTYATLNDAFTRASTLPPRGRASTGWARRPAATTARAATSRCGTPTCSTRTRPAEFTAGRAAGRPARGPHEHRVRPVLHLDPVLLPPGRTRAGRWRARSSTTATAASYDFTATRGVPRSTSPAASTPSTSSPGRRCPSILEAYTWLTGRTAPPPLWSLGYHQCRWFDYTQDAVEALAHAPPRRAASRATPCGSTSTTWTATASSPGTPSTFPDVAGMLTRLARAGLPRRSRSSTRA